MTVQRLDNTAIVVEDLDAAVAFFSELGLLVDGRAEISGPWADATVGLDGIESEIAVLRTPDGHGRIELTSYTAPTPIAAAPPAPNTIGLHRVMFAVDDLEATVERLLPHGAELLGEIARYEDAYLLCYLRGPSGIVVALAQQID